MIEVATVDARGSIIASAAFRSAWPSAFVKPDFDHKAITVLHQGMALIA
jgi:hypothetical protein